MIPLAHFNTATHDGLPVVEAFGEIDISNVSDFQRELNRAAHSDPGVVIVVLNGITYFDSKGLNALMQFAERLKLTRQTFVAVASPGTFSRRILEMISAERAFALVDSLEDALPAGRPG